MAVVENAGINVDSSNRTESMDQSKSNHMGTQQHHHQGNNNNNTTNPILRSNDHQHHHQSFHMIAQQQKMMSSPATMNNNTAQVNGNGTVNNHKSVAQVSVVQQHGNGELMRNHGDDDDDGGEGFKQEMRDLEEMLSKLNPMAEEFVPHLSNYRPLQPSNGFLGYSNNFLMQTNSGIANGNTARRKKNSYSQGKRRINSRTSMAQREEVIRRTVYVSDIDHQVTEEQLAALFISCGQVVDCRVCGDPNSVLRFAFIEFTDEEGARNALSLAGTMLGYYPVRVLPSKTAIAPVNPTFLPRSEDEREMCARTIYCTNIDKKVTQADVKLFFESICGEVHRLRLLGDYQHSTHIAFVEFIMAESAIAALNCSGAVLGSLPIRVSPSKTPVRPRTPRASIH
ncbi:Polyadenylate-binding protein-interacting protein 11 [Camellia lanceoleosa]|uniref:Polyadenylate-binding protein-interacting protein 11 n=1 Tax=Camellia lanceoleosa TaxID=1840588 RepID=A0ACC0J418_9ERIC|nr:Polyadenylate-binding protein-interacting protein 11 [Camellia lanceoleosa]